MDSCSRRAPGGNDQERARRATAVSIRLGARRAPQQFEPRPENQKPVPNNRNTIKAAQSARLAFMQVSLYKDRTEEGGFARDCVLGSIIGRKCRGGQDSEFVAAADKSALPTRDHVGASVPLVRWCHRLGQVNPNRNGGGQECPPHTRSCRRERPAVRQCH